MNYQKAIQKLNQLLGLYKFKSYKSSDGEGEFITEGGLIVDEPIFIITENGQFPAPDGEFELEDSTKIKIQDGHIKEINYDMEKQKFVEATLKDGTVVKSPTFDVGEPVTVVNPDGTEIPAPDGEHELMLKDSEGKEVLFKIKTLDGMITERENVELPEGEEREIEINLAMTPDLSDSATTADEVIADEEFKSEVMKTLKSIKEMMGGMKEDYENMKAKVDKFSKEPAGEPIRQSKNVAQEFNSSKLDAFQQLMRIRHGLDKQ